MQPRVYSTDWSWPVFFRGFGLGFGRFVGAGFFFFCVLFPFSGQLSLSLEGVLMGSGAWVALAALYGTSEGSDAVKAWRERMWRARFSSHA